MLIVFGRNTKIDPPHVTQRLPKLVIKLRVQSHVRFGNTGSRKFLKEVSSGCSYVSRYSTCGSCSDKSSAPHVRMYKAQDRYDAVRCILRACSYCTNRHRRNRGSWWCTGGAGVWRDLATMGRALPSSWARDRSEQFWMTDMMNSRQLELCICIQ